MYKIFILSAIKVEVVDDTFGESFQQLVEFPFFYVIKMMMKFWMGKSIPVWKFLGKSLIVDNWISDSLLSAASSSVLHFQFGVYEKMFDCINKYIELKKIANKHIFEANICGVKYEYL